MKNTTRFIKTPDKHALTANEFRDIRTRMGLTQEQMSAYLGHRHGRVVRRWESGAVQVPQTVSRMIALVQRLPQAVREQANAWLKEQGAYEGYEK